MRDVKILHSIPLLDRAATDALFTLTVQRKATDAELGQYLALTRHAIKVAGNAEGLRQMLKAVLPFTAQRFARGTAQAHLWLVPNPPLLCCWVTSQLRAV